MDRLVKAQGDAHPDVLALAGGVGVGACAAPKPAEAAAEDVPEDVPQVHPAKAAEAAGPAALAGRVVGVHSRKAELVVALALFRVGQDLVGLVDLLEFFLGGLVAGVVVRVVFQRQLTVGLLDLLVRGCLGYPQDLVIVTFFLCHFHSPLAASCAGLKTGKCRPGKPERLCLYPAGVRLGACPFCLCLPPVWPGGRGVLLLLRLP